MGSDTFVSGMIYVDHPHGDTFRIRVSMEEEMKSVHEKNMGVATTEIACRCGHELSVAFGVSAWNYGFPVRGKNVVDVAHYVAATEIVVETVSKIKPPNFLVLSFAHTSDEYH